MVLLDYCFQLSICTLLGSDIHKICFGFTLGTRIHLELSKIQTVFGAAGLEMGRIGKNKLIWEGF